jgi:adenylate kinase family enzyme
VRILIIGAAGSGTTTLGRELAAQMGAAFFDADEFFWHPSEPPYQAERDPAERLATIIRALGPSPSAVVAGSIIDWGADLENSFSLIVYLWVEADVRVARLMRRESERFGQPLDGFIEWAAQYDEGRLPGRSRATHERWLSERKCPVLRIEGNVSVMEAASRVIEALSDLSLESRRSSSAAQLSR